jgi:monofunctional biosynthetic peptidoglycan transglycosylase
MRQRIEEAREAGDSLAIRQEWVPLERISRHVVRAVLLAEDQRFPDHDGVDWRALAEEVKWEGGPTFSWSNPLDLAALGAALRYAWERREEIRGRSTLTQQLAKNLYFGTDRSFLRKAMELVVARRLEMALSKDRILELYLNLVVWGPGVFGVEAAARTYFGRSAETLTMEQAAALAATLPHPLTSNPSRSPAQMQWRQALILERMRPRADSAPPLPPLPPPILPPIAPETPAPEVPAPETPAPEVPAPEDPAPTVPAPDPIPPL